MRRFVAVLVALSGLLLGSLTTATGASAGGEGTLPVPYTIFPISLVGLAPGGNAPGTNDWSCKPSAAHPRPVVLVHATGVNGMANWQTYGPLLKNNGYCVFALTYGTISNTYPLNRFGALGPMEASAEQLRVFVDKVLAATGAEKVDLIGHSQGTLMPNYYVKFLGGAPKVGTYISLAPLWHGSLTSGVFASAVRVFGLPAIPICTACDQWAWNSAFIQKMHQGGRAAVPGVNYVNVITRYDQAVVPYTSGYEPGMTNILLQDLCPFDITEHIHMGASRTASLLVLNALDPAHPRPVTCGNGAPVDFGSKTSES